MTIQFYNTEDTYAEAFDPETGECILRRAFDPEKDIELPPYILHKKTWMVRRLAAIRYDHETSGIPFESTTIQTDRQSQAMLTSAMVMAPDSLTSWKMGDGKFLDIVPRDLGVLVAAHVQACFANEAKISRDIREAHTVDALDALDMQIGWP